MRDMNQVCEPELWFRKCWPMGRGQLACQDHAKQKSTYANSETKKYQFLVPMPAHDAAFYSCVLI
jgi:hypothetical protein